jgi:hypothetical protein
MEALVRVGKGPWQGCLSETMEESGINTTLLHNMSAPSRMQITVRPLEKTSDTGQRADGPVQRGSYQGLKLYGVLSLHRLFVDGLHAYPESIPKYYSQVNNTHTSLSMLCELTSACLMGKNTPVRMRNAWVDKSPEEIEAGFISLCQKIDTSDFPLPIFGLVKSFKGNIPATGLTLDPLQFVSILCRISGHLFMAERNPLIPDGLPRRRMLGIYHLHSSTLGD